ncbi:MAG: serine/threonine protein kinase [Deltaproteobacteria bacterium]|nr:serine/threonine protein kinase [Deltaproteobacteria bacterium]
MPTGQPNETLVPDTGALKKLLTEALEKTEGFADDDSTSDPNSQPPTWVDEVAAQLAQSLESVTPGRRTVLPRIEVTGDQPPVLITTRERRYDIVKKLGAGAVGDVFLAKDADIGRQIAVKKIESAAQSSSAMLRFIKEVQTVGRLEHPNIVPIHDVGQDEAGDYYFVMKYVEGMTLEQLIDKLREGDASTHLRFGIEERVQLVRGLMEAVAFAHTRGVVHRDIKPANVMIGPYGEVLLLDWGIAKSDGTGDPTIGTEDTAKTLPHTRDGTLIGTPRYMSPEQARKLPVDQRSDVYSLSVLTHELLTLHHYLDDIEDLEALLRAVQERPLPLASTVRHPHQDPVPMDLSWFIDKGVSKDPADRYQTVDEMLDRLQQRAEGHIPVQCPVTFTKQAANQAERVMDRHLVPMMGPLMAAGTAGLVIAALLMAAMVGMVLAMGVAGIVAATLFLT